MGNSSNKSVADTMADDTVGNSSMADNSVGDSSMANSSNNTVANNTVANNTVGDRSNNAGGDDSRANPVSADTVGGAWVVGDSSNVGSESLGLGHTPVLSLQGLHHGLVGHLASADSDSRGNSNSRSDSSGVGNASNETGSSHEASHCTVASQELGSGGGGGHEGGDTEGGLRESDFDIVAKRTENDIENSCFTFMLFWWVSTE